MRSIKSLGIVVLLLLVLTGVEKALIKQALTQANGRVTHAASLLSMSYQALAYIIESRHKDLLKERSPVHRRRPRKEPSDN